MERERLGSRLGFILVSAGCAIGIGNVWKFPYMVGQYGGGAFVLCYLFFLLMLSVPVLTIEFSVGRAAKKSPVKIYQELEKPGQKWHIHGYLSMVGCYLLMMYYTTVAGWMLYYLYASITGKYAGLDAEGVAGVFGGLLSSPATCVFCLALVIIMALLILSRGLQNGLERVTKGMMIFLLIIMIFLAVNSILLEGGKEGLEFYLKPDFGRMKEAGIGTVILGAMSQAFFTLGIGIGSMAIFGSYIDRSHALFGESINIAVLDTFVAFCSGFIIFPACSAYNVDVTSGPPLLFITLPNVFNNLPGGGRVWGTLFFLFMVAAAFSTVLAVFENNISMCMDAFGWSRKKACYINIPALFLLSLPCTLGYNLLIGIEPLGPGTQILDFEDFIVSNLMLPLGCITYVLFCTTKYGWGWEKFTEEANAGEGLKLQPWMKPYFKYILPVIIAIVFIAGLL